jgi:hypothetical protein
MDLRGATSSELWGVDDCPKQPRRSTTGRLYWDCQFQIDGANLYSALVADEKGRLRTLLIELDLLPAIRSSAATLESSAIQLNSAAIDFFAELMLRQQQLVAAPNEVYSRRGTTLLVRIESR